jgi:uncharacterized protein
MNPHCPIELLTRCMPELVARFGAARLSPLGSMARDTAEPRGDVDVVVPFDDPASSSRSFGVQVCLEDLLGRSVDPVTERALRPEPRSAVERERERFDVPAIAACPTSCSAWTMATSRGTAMVAGCVPVAPNCEYTAAARAP